MIFIKDFVIVHLTTLLGSCTFQLADFKLASPPKNTKGTLCTNLYQVRNRLWPFNHQAQSSRLTGQLQGLMSLGNRSRCRHQYITLPGMEHCKSSVQFVQSPVSCLSTGAHSSFQSQEYIALYKAGSSLRYFDHFKWYHIVSILHICLLLSLCLLPNVTFLSLPALRHQLPLQNHHWYSPKLQK